MDLKKATISARRWADIPRTEAMEAAVLLYQALFQVAQVARRLHFQSENEPSTDRDLIESLRAAGVFAPQWDVKQDPNEVSARIYRNGSLFATCTSRENAEVIRSCMEQSDLGE